MMRHPILASGATFAVALLATAAAASAAGRLENWTDLSGTKFRGEPVEVLGPIALFRTGPDTGRRVALRLLSPEDCVRVYRGVHERPAPAADWTSAGGVVARELLDRVLRVNGEQLGPVSLAGRPEPAFYMLFFASHGEGRSWGMMGDAVPPYAKLQQDHPGLVEALYFGLRHSSVEHARMATQMHLPWLVADFARQDELRTIARFAPRGGFAFVIVNRDGVPLFSSNAATTEAVQQVFQEFTGLIDLLRPNNPRTWPDRLHYLRAVRVATHREDRAPPLLVGHPLDAAVLREHGVTRFTASIRVGADGRVGDVTLQTADAMPEAIANAIAAALQHAVIVPAVDRGRFIEDELQWQFAPTP